MKPVSRASIAAVAVAFWSCGDPTRINARFEVVSDTITVSALSGSSIGARTALNTLRHEAVRAEPGSNFDVVFDITSAGQAVIYPAQAISSLGRAGIQRSTQQLDSILVAPSEGYSEAMTPTSVSVGDVILIRAVQAACRPPELNPYIFSKLQITAIDTVARTVTFVMRVDPNCGFRSFRDGIPTL